jgi:hypothetical protein
VRTPADASGRPLGGAVVTLLDASGRPRAQAATTTAGRWLFPAPGAGVFRVSVRRVGFVPYTSAPVRLTATDTADVELRVPSTRVVLPAVAVTARAGCGPLGDGRDRADDAAILWEQIRIALTASEIARVDSAAPVILRVVRRHLSATGVLEHADTTPPRSTTERPFYALASATLSRRGYIARDTAGGLSFYAPDAATMLSPEFVRDHCFGLTAGRGATAGLVGLVFEPVPGRRVPDVGGTLWADAATAELRFLEYGYRNAGLPVRVDDIGGRVAFERLASGAWIVRGWRIRMPTIGAGRGVLASAWLVGYVEFGGWARASGEADVAVLPISAPIPELGQVAGFVFDSLLGAPLPGAVVWVPEAGRSTIADSAGRFTLDSVPAGRRFVSFGRADLDSAGISAPGAVVDVATGETTMTLLSTPSFETLRAASCPAPAPGDSLGVLFGEVRDAESGERLPGARTHVSWVLLNVAPAGARSRKPIVQEASLELTADSAGTYWACQIPPSLEVGLRRIARRDLTVSREVIAAVTASAPARRGAAPGTTGDPMPRTGLATVVGTVRDTLGAPRAGAHVTVDGAAGLATTDSAGRFRLSGLPAGTQTLEARAIGYAPARLTVELRNRESTEAHVALTRGTVLVGVRVEERRRDRNRAEFEERRRLGFGYFITAERLRNMLHVRSAFQAIPSVVVSSVGRSALDFRVVLMNGARPCTPPVWIDGVLGAQDMLSGIQTTDIIGIEVYHRFNTTPAKYQAGAGDCGVILVWTNFVR